MQACRKATRKSAGGALSENEVQDEYGRICSSSFRISQADAVAAVIRYFEQGEVEVTSKKVSLLCPISKTRIKDPARGVDCKHLECFDLRSYLEYHTQIVFWDCPFEFCKAKVHLDSVRIDE
ncbi:MIZ zinc finger protein [Aphelenchoides avenae]|nr:MIZ zinc finger protein [Aphelenchus avenae]